MAEIQEPYVIINLGDQEKNESCLFPVRNYTDDDIVVVTTSTNTISLVKVSDSKSFKSWSVPQNQPFTCPVISDGCSNGLLCVQNKFILRQWDSDSDSINTGSKTKFSSSIYELVTISGKEPLIIFENGSCNVLSNAIENCTQETDSCLLQNESILRSEVSIRGENVHIIHRVFSEQKKDIFYHLILSIDDFETKSVRRATVNRTETELIDWTLNKDTNESPLLTLWSNGEICQHSAEFESFQVACLLPSGPNWLSFKSLDAAHVLVASQENQCNILDLWDVKFKVRKHRKKIETILYQNMQMALLNGDLWMRSSNQVLLCGLKTGNSSLLASIGMLSMYETQGVTMQNCLWNEKGLIDLNAEKSDENCKTVSLICKETLSHFLEKKNAKGIINIIQRWNDLPESEIYRVLLFFLQVDNNTLLNKGFPTGHSKEVFSEEKSFCLSQVLSLQFNDEFLLCYLKKLPTDKVYTLLVHLNNLLKNSLFSQGSLEMPIKQIINWINILFDVHFNFFTLTNDANIQNFLIELIETVNKYTQFSQEMDDLDPLVLATQQGIKVSSFQNKSLYCIEILDI